MGEVRPLPTLTPGVIMALIKAGSTDDKTRYGNYGRSLSRHDYSAAVQSAGGELSPSPNQRPVSGFRT